MSSPPKSIGLEALSMDALTKMEREKITSLVVLDNQGRLCGVVHIHDILRHGLGL
jgi:arabinose-5-phosphate isomerase